MILTWIFYASRGLEWPIFQIARLKVIEAIILRFGLSKAYFENMQYECHQKGYAALPAFKGAFCSSQWLKTIFRTLKRIFTYFR